MLSFDQGHQRFQVRAAAVIRHAGHVLLHRLEPDDFWALPGGRLTMGEEAGSAIVREMHEELGEAVVCGPLLYVAESFFGPTTRPYHELGLYFETSLAADSRLLALDATHHGQEGEQLLIFRWFPEQSLGAVDLRPAFLRGVLRDPSNGIRHIIDRT
jgi:ADP-ribose pyrophosphatase YjhB (NUDIX family)